jgi:ADP-ribose pyrophosphatase YjhB (NUDIX family)
MPTIDVEHYHPGRIFSYCPRCGQAWEFRAPNFFSCRACGFSYYHGVSAAGSAMIIGPGAQIVLIRRAHDPQKGMLDLVGGFIEYGESAEEGLRREIREELNLSVESLVYFGSFPNRYFYKGLLYYTLDMTYLCSIDDISTLRASDDAAEYVVRTVDPALLSEIAFESSRAAIEQFMAAHH